MNRRLVTIAAAAAALLACSNCMWADALEKYKVTVPVDASRRGQTVYLLNYDTAERLDSLSAIGETVVFSGEIAEPVPAALSYGKERPSAVFVLEGGSMVFRPADGAMVGSMLNDRMNEVNGQLAALVGKFQAAPSQAEQEAIYAQYGSNVKAAMKENVDNPLGYFFFLDSQQFMEPQELSAFVAANPRLGAYKRVRKAADAVTNLVATQPGKKYRDFTVYYNGKAQSLSDYVVKGKYTLVDFWASWCGPCLRQLPVLKELYNTYKSKGLNIVGVAVWDDPTDTEEAIKEHDLPWPCIINAEQVPTDLYGITGIPCIMLIGPDGTILSRDLQGDELKSDVARIMSGK